MIVRLLTFVFLGVLVWLIWRWKHSPAPEQRRKLILSALFWAMILLVVAMAATGRIHWLGAAFAGVLVGIKQLGLLALRFFPALAQIYGRHRTSQSSQSSQAGSSAATSTSMSESEARQILDVGPDADVTAIKRAHRTQMSKQHPDHGGNAYFAAKLNQARDVLMAARKKKESG